MRKLFLPVILLATVSTILLIACQKENSSDTHSDGNGNGQTTMLRINLTDAPIDADSVNVDIQEVRVNYRNDSSGWVSMNTIAGIYDLLGLQNGVDTLIAAGPIPTNTVKEIRFILGSNNSIVVNGVNYPLTIPSGSESGLKLKINKQLNGPLDSILIDFDAALSVHQTGNGEYKLKPVLKIK
jgi:Domain of unknown function (DUF4382)